MSKYSTDFKLHMVKEYLEWDLEYESRAHKYKISSHTPITEWVR